MNRYRLTLLTGLLLAACGLNACSRKPGSLAELLPADCRMVIELPHLAGSARALDEFAGRLAQGPAALFYAQLRRTLEQRLGFAPGEQAGWRELGLDPSAAAALALTADEQAVVAVPVLDGSKLVAGLKRQLGRLAGEVASSERQVAGTTVRSFHSQVAGQRQDHLQLVLLGRHALLAGAQTPPERLAELARTKVEESLARAAWYARRRGLASESATLVMALNPAGGPGAGASGLVKLAPLLAATFSRQGLELQLALEMPQAKGEKPASWLAQTADAHLERRLPAQALLAVKLRVEPRTVLEQLLATDEAARRRFQRKLAAAQNLLGVDVEAATLDNLTGNLALGLGLADAAAAGAGQDDEAGAAARLARRGWALAWLEVKDPRRLEKLLQVLREKLGQQYPAREQQLADVRVTSLETPGGQHLALVRRGNLAGLCLGVACEQQARQALAGEGGNLVTSIEPAARRLFERAVPVAGLLRLAPALEQVSRLDRQFLGEDSGGARLLVEVLKASLGGVTGLGCSAEQLSGQLRLGAWLWLK